MKRYLVFSFDASRHLMFIYDDKAETPTVEMAVMAIGLVSEKVEIVPDASSTKGVSWHE